MEILIDRPKLKFDLIAALDKITAQNPDLKPYEIRSEIAHVFRAATEAAGWDFRTETWPALREAVNASINPTPEREIMGYMEYLGKYCE
jgi:hypothetical protein